MGCRAAQPAPQRVVYEVKTMLSSQLGIAVDKVLPFEQPFAFVITKCDTFDILIFMI